MFTVLKYLGIVASSCSTNKLSYLAFQSQGGLISFAGVQMCKVAFKEAVLICGHELIELQNYWLK